MLIHKDEDVKSEASNKESISVIISIFHSIKCSEDIVDAAKSKVGKTLLYVCYCWLLNLSMKTTTRTQGLGKAKLTREFF